MSYSIMEALFDGRVIPWERRNTYAPEHKALGEKMERQKQYFIKQMSEEDSRRFRQLEDLFFEAAFDEEVEIYSHGFTLGALLMVEVMEKKGAMINR